MLTKIGRGFLTNFIFYTLSAVVILYLLGLLLCFQ